MGLLHKLFWVALFVLLTFSFVVLFEHGSKDFVTDYSKNATIEYNRFQAYIGPGKTNPAE